jgi:glycine cleavage system transcriptional repressor
MELAITVLGPKTNDFLVEALSAINSCQCSIVELRSANLTELTALYLLVDGSWNHIAKLQPHLESSAKQFQVQIHMLRPEEDCPVVAGIPYTVETMCLDDKDVLLAITAFLTERGILIEEVTASRQQAAFFKNTVFSSKLLLLVPDHVAILSLREDFLDFCDSLNIDAILEPIKR